MSLFSYFHYLDIFCSVIVTIQLFLAFSSFLFSDFHYSVILIIQLLYVAGQQVVEEVLDAQGAGCPREYFNIKIPKGHPQYDPDGHGDREMPLLRTRYDFNTGKSPNVPRQQLNEITPYLDGGLVYGINKAWADALRSFKGGLLKATNDSDDTMGYYPAYNDIRLPLANPPPPRDHTLKNVNRFHSECRMEFPRSLPHPILFSSTSKPA